MAVVHSAGSILIVGAGPTGLALAAELRRLGAEPTIFDRQPAGANTSRACVVHAATMEALAPLGVTADLIELGVKVPVFRIRDRDAALLTIDFSELRTEYPFTLMCPQDRVERTLEARLRRLGGRVARGWELLEFEDHGQEVAARVRTDGGIQELRSSWIIGCDGMHSAVRSGAQIPFDGGQYKQDFVLADVRMDWPISQDEVTLFYSPAGLMVVAPLPEQHYRIVATVDRAPELITSDFIQHLLATRGPASRPGRLRGIAWSSRFHIHHRVARTPRKGRVLLCGDAAHVHSPAGGQGMNTGIQDATSLAHELVRIGHDGDERRLENWAARRHHVAADVVALTHRMTRLATIRSPSMQHVRNWAVAIAGRIPALRTSFARTLAELDAD
jgi:2-polyprenyl-6-methoxyphenol hydroxylase-like FAD-dependent oxidoreductase